jgi:NADH-quinone oxidoreductase subunit C
MSEPEELQKDPVVERLRVWDPQAVTGTFEFRGERTIIVPRSHLRRVAELLQGAPELAYNILSDISAVDRFPVEPRFELNYHLLSIPHRAVLRVRVSVESTDAVVPTVTPVWPTANWHEREVFDLFGVRFEGHPDMRRILMPEDWEGFPLRKDYRVEGYR